MVVRNTSINNAIENLVIVGSGPAGYTAAIYAARANLKPILFTGFEVGGIAGGQLMTTTFVENFPGFPNGIMGPELMNLVKAQAIRWGTELIEDDVTKIDLSQTPFEVRSENHILKSHALVIATGARANRLGLKQEEKFWSKGISACAICDGTTPQFRNEELVVVGGGDSACEEAVFLTKYASKVHLLVRSRSFRASAALSKRVRENAKISIYWNTEILDLEGDDWMSNVRIIDRETKSIKTISARGLFYAIGHTPNTELIATQLEIDPKGYIVTSPGRPETSLDGVFAAGDVADSEWRQGITAAGSGCKAALAAERWLSENNLGKPIEKKELEPEKVKASQDYEISTENNYDPNALWQKGSYALRKLYHDSNKPLLVVYTSTTCGPCYVLKPQLQRVIEEFSGKAQGIEIDIEAEQDIASQAGVTGTPTVQLFHKKTMKKQWRGVKQRSEFRQAIDELLKN